MTRRLIARKRLGRSADGHRQRPHHRRREGGAGEKAVTANSLGMRGYKQNGLEKVDVSPSGRGSFDVYRNGVRIATVQATAYTDNINKKGAGSYTYKVCDHATNASCSNEASVTF
jgi:hypothetical protein